VSGKSTAGSADVRYVSPGAYAFALAPYPTEGRTGLFFRPAFWLAPLNVSGLPLLVQEFCDAWVQLKTGRMRHEPNGKVQEGLGPQRMARRYRLARVEGPAQVTLPLGQPSPPQVELLSFILGHPSDATEKALGRKTCRCKGAQCEKYRPNVTLRAPDVTHSA
jgi:hypothetical protein